MAAQRDDLHLLPQALFNVLPSILSQFVSAIKETTLGYVINVPELTFAANQINNQLLTKPFQVFASWPDLLRCLLDSDPRGDAAGAPHRHAAIRPLGPPIAMNATAATVEP